MRRWGLPLGRLLGAVGLACALGCAGQGEAPARRPPGWLLDPERMKAGVVLGLYSQQRGFDYSEHLREIQSLGAEWVELLVTQWQEDARSTCIGPDPLKTPTDEEVARAIRQAHGLGLRVMLFPIVLLRNPGAADWRGNLQPDSIHDWFDSYRAMLLGYAELADREGVEALSLGSELASLENQSRKWRRLIRATRARYSGLLLYSANWDHYDLAQAKWLGELDMVGVSAYFALASDTRPTLAGLVHAWRPIEADLRAWQAKLGRPILFTELGYPSVDGTAMTPWNYLMQGPVDLEEQELCYRAFQRAWAGSDLLRGVFFYEWWERGGALDRSYTPRGKPARAVLQTILEELSFDAAGTNQ